jgi:hypothetical protein
MSLRGLNADSTALYCSSLALQMNNAYYFITKLDDQAILTTNRSIHSPMMTSASVRSDGIADGACSHSTMATAPKPLHGMFCGGCDGNFDPKALKYCTGVSIQGDNSWSEAVDNHFAA